MANYRQVHTKIWKDDWFLDLSPLHKLFFVYLFTNERACLAGIYELSQKVMVFESGLTSKQIDEAFTTFEADRKAYYRDGVVWIANLRKYHETSSQVVQTRIMKDVAEVKECELKAIYCEVYGIDTVSIGSQGVDIPLITSKSTSTSESKSSLRGGSGGRKKTDPEYERLLEVWERDFPDKPQPRPNNKTLLGKFRTRLKVAHFAENWPAALDRAARSDWLRGEGFFDLGWFLKNNENYEKCLNGNYDNKASPNGQPQPRSDLERLKARRQQEASQ